MRPRQLSELEQKLLARQLEADLVARCLFCRWSRKGPARLVLAAQRRHHERKHGIVKQSQRTKPQLSTFRQRTLTESDMTEIQAERMRRAFLNGVTVG